MLDLLGPLIKRECKFVLSQIVIRELNKHYELTYDAISKPIKSIQNNLPRFSDDQDILNKFNEFKDSLQKKKSSNNPLDKFISQTKAEVIPYKNVDLDYIMDSYFGTDLPFHAGKKKAEFPDAVAVYSLDRWIQDYNAANGTNLKINAVSCDNDWNLFAEKFADRWTCYKSIKDAIDQMNRARRAHTGK